MRAELALVSARVKQQLVNVSDDALVAPMPMQFEADLHVCRPFLPLNSSPSPVQSDYDFIMSPS